MDAAAAASGAISSSDGLIGPWSRERRRVVWRPVVPGAALWALAGTVWALLYLWHGQMLARLPGPMDEEPLIGRHLALGHGFSSPFDPSAQAPPSSWSPPVYPALVATI